MPDAEASSSAANAAEKAKTKLKPRSPLEIFRTEWIAGQHAQRKINPCSKESWDACKRDFEQLADERKRELERQSESEKTHAKLARSLAKARAKCQPAEQEVAAPQPLAVLQDAPSSAAPPDQNPDGLAQMMQRDATTREPPSAPPLPSCLACTSLKTPLVEQARGKFDVGNARTARAPAYGDFPIAPAEVRNFMRPRSFNIQTAVGDFAKAANHMQGAPLGDSIPDRVMYPKRCGDMCRVDNTARSVKFHDKLVALLHSMIRDHCNKSKDVPAANLVFAAECYKDPGGEQPDAITFYAVASAVGQQAHHVAQASMAKLKPHQADVATRLDSIQSRIKESKPKLVSA